MSPFPQCPTCGPTHGHEWHGNPCREPIRSMRNRCGCPSSLTDPSPDGLEEFGPGSHNPPPEAA
ncbi:MAG: hypothetical protein NVSMB4_07340 [Acidimicrobiales bacterium]